jgi:DtxR family transcriptional regulator, Mn-dependent transcriptional regulator
MAQKQLTPTMEDYLETFFLLSKEKGAIRVKNIAKRLGVKMSTVTNMLKTLSEKGMIDYEKHEYLELTKKGHAVGKEMFYRHQTFKSFLTDILKIDPDQADEDACKMEHAVSPATLEAFVDFMEFIENCPRGGAGWLEYFKDYREHGQPKDKCLEKMKQFVHDYSAKIEDMELEK